ncbi:MAG: hypothetical protein WKF75_07265 [Singulisphaera sp.]
MRVSDKTRRPIGETIDAVRAVLLGRRLLLTWPTRRRRRPGLGLAIGPTPGRRWCRRQGWPPWRTRWG